MVVHAPVTLDGLARCSFTTPLSPLPSLLCSHATSLVPVITCVESSNKLVSICDQGPGNVKMPYTLQLVKQLRKELNVEKLMKEKHKSNKECERAPCMSGSLQ